jgi:hypothetical protein
VTITAEKDATAAAPMSVSEKIEIDVGGKYRVHIGGGFDKQVQEALRRDPHAGDLYVFRGVSGNLIKILWA